MLFGAVHAPGSFIRGTNMSKLLIKNIGRLQTPVGSFPHKGKAQGENLKLDNAEVLCEDGIIKAITGKTIKLSEEVEEWILKKVDEEDNGARPIIRIIQQNIEEAISDMVINDDPVLKTKKKYLTAVLDEDKIILK